MQSYRGAWGKTTHQPVRGSGVGDQRQRRWFWNDGAWVLKSLFSIIRASFNVTVFTQNAVQCISVKSSMVRRAWTEKGKSPLPLPLFSHVYKWEYAVHVSLWLASFCFALEIFPYWSNKDWSHYHEFHVFKIVIFSIHPVLHLTLSSVLTWIVENLTQPFIDKHSRFWVFQFLPGKYSVKVSCPLPRTDQGWGQEAYMLWLGDGDKWGLWVSWSPGIH